MTDDARPKHWALTHIIVDPDARGRGAGTRMLRRVLRDADRKGHHLTLAAHQMGTGGLDTAALESWYARHGFEKQGPIMNRPPGGTKGRLGGRAGGGGGGG